MAQKQTGSYCTHCQKDVMATGTRPNHLLHLMLTLVTLGFWIPIWLSISICKLEGYRCTQCGKQI